MRHRLFAFSLLATGTFALPAAIAADAPLARLPYTPSLDRRAMDTAAAPCEDFYQYVCGGWMQRNPIPADQASWSVYGKLATENQRFLWGLLEQASQPTATRSTAEGKIGDYFSACMNESAIEQAGADPLAPELAAIDALRSPADLARYLGRTHPGIPGDGLVFGFGSNMDFEDSSRVIAFAGAGGLGLPERDYYTRTDTKSVEIRRQYLAHVQRMLQLTGQDETIAARGAEAVMTLETDLAKASLTPVEKRDPYKLLHRMTRAELQSLTPAFDWNAYLAGMGLDAVDEINVMEPAFYRELDRLIGQRALADWQSYLRWQLTNARAPGLSSAFVAADFDFYRRTLRGVPTDMPRWKKCVRGVDRDLGEALGQVFVARTFSADTRARTVEMTHHIEVAMEQEINALPWMSAETKTRALEKLHTIVNKVGYPDTWRDYSALEVKPGDFAGNLRRAAVFESRRQLAKIGKPVDRGEWGMTPPTVNAYYNPQMNDINFPAGVLQPPLYDPAMDDAPNYGNTGSTIGHELTHGFDDEGRQFDARGNLKDWWKKADAQGFDERLQCVQEQYAEYVVVDDIRINSKLTSGEDVADLGGTLLAYIAWQAATSEMKLAPIEGFSPEQRFFIGLGQWACENDRPENLRVSASTDPHSPGRYRINGVVANMPEFQKAFACKAGQPMVREKPCRIW